MAKPYLTSNDLIEDVKRTIAVPLSQNTFDEEDILAFATKELFLSQVPSILQFHEEFLVYSTVIQLENGKVRYPIPSRAIGMKLRDVNYRDSNGNIYEMSKINPDDKTYFQRFAGGHTVTRHYYLENNSIVLTPFNEGMSAQGSLEITYYLRPNSLVTNDKAAICTAFSKSVTVDNSNLVAGDVLTIGSNQVVAGTNFVIGATSQATAANLSNYLNTLTGITASVSLAVVDVRYKLLSTSISSNNPAGMSVQQTQTVVFDQVPENIANGTLIDFLQTLGGHSTYSYDILLGDNVVSTNSVIFNSGEVPADFKVGDYICSAYECIIPQIPDDLHNLLVERTCSRILESLGDSEGLKNVNNKINDLEARQSTIIDNRVEGSPTKVLNRHSLLRYGKNRSIRGRL